MIKLGHYSPNPKIESVNTVVVRVGVRFVISIFELGHR
ncbi:hypothetical protein SPBRAN_1360 [uncultured Candidatus Thioglobus sp.]|nr:hypothetical protein SPBRAN_1360 [uncultured Candidatus Thioglobus sp.]